MSLIKAYKESWTLPFIPGRGDMCKECIYYYENLKRNNRNRPFVSKICSWAIRKTIGGPIDPKLRAYAGVEKCDRYVKKGPE